MTQFKKPPLLKPGDRVAIVAPAGRAETSYVEKSIFVFEDWGLTVEKGKHLLGSFHQFSGTDEQRLRDLQYAIDSDDIKAVICARGGYGTLRILDQIHWTKFLQNPKWLVGFSDITALHFSIQHLNIQSIHSVMPINMESMSSTSLPVEMLAKAFFEGKVEYELPPHKLNITGTEVAPVVGGNLSLLNALSSTPYALDFEGKILFLEDVGEKFYHIDRMMQSLRLTGKLEKLSGLIVGGLSKMKDDERPFGKCPEEIIKEVVDGFDFPVVFGFPAGHIPDNRPLIFGAETAMEVRKDFVKIKMG